jgi:hypothetical protein
MAEHPKYFPSVVGTQIQSYDYLDIISGTGIKDFYGGAIQDSTGESFFLSPTQFEPWHTNRAAGNEVQNSGRFQIAYPLSATPDTKAFDLDFDTSVFTIAQRIDGDVVINLPYAFDPGVSTDRYNLYVTGKVRIWDGTTETEVANNTSATQTIDMTSGSTSDAMISFKVTVDDQLVRVGEQLRITLEVYAWRSAGSGNCAILIITDPYGRDVANLGTGDADEEIFYDGGRPLLFKVPFKVYR